MLSSSSSGSRGHCRVDHNETKTTTQNRRVADADFFREYFPTTLVKKNGGQMMMMMMMMMSTV